MFIRVVNGPFLVHGIKDGINLGDGIKDGTNRGVGINLGAIQDGFNLGPLSLFLQVFHGHNRSFLCLYSNNLSLYNNLYKHTSMVHNFLGFMIKDANVISDVINDGEVIFQ
jgi:hypothetical protein